MATILETGEDGVKIVLRDNSGPQGAADLVALSVDPKSGKVTAGASFAAPAQLLQDTWDKESADAAASTVTAEHCFFRAAAAIQIKAVRYVPDAALTSNDATFATITVSVRNADGTNQQTVASVSTKTSGSGGSGNWTQWVAVALALTAANATLAAGQILTVSIAKASTGVIVPAGELVLDYCMI